MCLFKVIFLFGIFYSQPFVLGLFDILPAYDDVELRLYHKTMDNYKVFTLGDPTGILLYMNHSIPTFFYTHGVNGSEAGAATIAVISTMLEVGGLNIVLLIWKKYARLVDVPFIPDALTGSISYAASAVPHAEGIGSKFGDVLVKLSEVRIPGSQVVGLKGSQVYLVGHSLGAHLMGQAGRFAKRKGFFVGRITGLDPAGVLFQGPLSFPELNYQCADYVDIVHTDCGHLGTNTSTGTVDIYPNFSIEGEVQPGCPVGDFEFLSDDDKCSHDRAWKLFCEAARYIGGLAGAGADNVTAWKSGQDKGITFIGPFIRLDAKGNYYLTTNAEPLYGKGMLGTLPPV